MRTRSLIAIATVLVIAIGVIASTSSARTSDRKRFTTGLINIDGNSSLNISVVNETSHQFNAAVQMHHGVGFLSTTAQTLLLTPHGKSVAVFACTSSGGCSGEPVVITRTGAFPSLEYIPDSSTTTPEFINIPSGDWRTF